MALRDVKAPAPSGEIQGRRVGDRWRQRAFDAHAVPQRHARRIDLPVRRLPAQRVHLVVEGLLQVDQVALARTVGPVLQGRER